MQNLILQKIKSLETEIKALKRLDKKTRVKKKGKKSSLYGILKGVRFSDEEIEEAKKAIFDFKPVT